MVKKNKSVKKALTKDLKAYSLDEVLDITYGPRDSAKRKIAYNKIAMVAQGIELANKIKEIREKLNKTQHDVAKIMAVDDSVISKLEKHFESAQLNTIIRYAKALKAQNVNIVFEFAKKEKHILQLNID